MEMKELEEIKGVWREGDYVRALGLCKGLWSKPEVMKKISTHFASSEG